MQFRLQSLEKRVDAIEARSELLIQLQFEMREVKQDVAEILRREKERERAEQTSRRQAVQDRKADRKWQLTVMAAWASAIIAAIAIIVPLLVGG